MSKAEAERSNVILVDREVLEQDLRLQVDGAGHLVPVCQRLRPARDARGALVHQERHQDSDCLGHLDLLQDVELLIVVSERSRSSIS